MLTITYKITQAKMVQVEDKTLFHLIRIWLIGCQFIISAL